MPLPEQLAYFEEHHQLYSDFVASLESSLCSGEEIPFLYRHPTMESFAFMEGECSAEDLEADAKRDGTYKPSTNFQEEAQEINDSIVAWVEDSLELARGEAGHFLLYASEPQDQYPQGKQLEPLPYDHAVSRYACIGPLEDDDPTLACSVCATDVFGMGANHETTLTIYTLAHELRGLTTQIGLIVSNQTIELAHQTLKFTEDDLLKRCEDMFGPNSLAGQLMDGDFEDEAQLDSNLATIVAAAKGIYPPEELEAISNAIRERALGHTMASLLDTTPDLEIIRTLTTFLQSVV